MGIGAIKEFCRPQSEREVVDLLGKYGNRAVLLAGGTFLHGLMARGLLAHADALVDLQAAGLSYVKAAAGAMSVGAMTTFRELAEERAVQEQPELGAVHDALQHLPAQILNMATVGGCVASAYSLFDLPVALMALDSSVKAMGAGGARVVALQEFHVDYFEHALKKGEFVSEIQVPKSAPRTASAFLTMKTNANDLALLNVAVRLTVDAAGKCQEGRVVFGGGVGKAPVRAPSCEAALQGERPGSATAEKAGQAVARDVHPVSDHRASAQYRRAIARVLLRKALHRAAERLGLKAS